MEKNTSYFGSVKFFKNMILLAVIILIAIPTVLSIYFHQKLKDTRLDLEEKAAQVETLYEEVHTLSGGDTTHLWSSFPTESPYADLYPDFYAPQEFCAEVRETNVIYLTFDDGPSASTADILDILKEKNVKATFFIIGNEGAENRALLQRMANEGHTLGMHSYSHNYASIYMSVEDYLADMYKNFTQIKEATGVAPTVFRFPGGSINGYNSGIYQELIAEMMRRGFVPFDWNISSQDAVTSTLLSADTLAENVVTGAEKVERGIVLMHDSSSRTTTVEALGPMIDRLKALNFELKALTPDTMPLLYAYSI